MYRENKNLYLAPLNLPIISEKHRKLATLQTDKIR